MPNVCTACKEEGFSTPLEGRYRVQRQWRSCCWCFGRGGVISTTSRIGKRTLIMSKVHSNSHAICCMYAWHCCLKCGGVGGSVPRVNIEEAPRQGHQNALAAAPRTRVQRQSKVSRRNICAASTPPHYRQHGVPKRRARKLELRYRCSREAGSGRTA